MTARPFIIRAPTGASRVKVGHSERPISPREMAEMAHACDTDGTNGTNALYLHVCDAGAVHGLGAGHLKACQAERSLSTKASVVLVRGRYQNELQSNAKDLAPPHAAQPSVGKWRLRVFGVQEHRCLRAVAAMCGDVRVGFENFLTDETGTLWPNLQASVEALTPGWRQAA